MFDYIKIGPSKSGYPYVLMLADKLSKVDQLVPTTIASAIPATKGIMDWGSCSGLPE